MLQYVHWEIASLLHSLKILNFTLKIAPDSLPSEPPVRV